MLFLFLLLTGCAYTVNTLAQVSPGGDGHEFYALVRTDYFGSPGHLRASEATLIRCVDKADPRATTCEPVLTSEQAFRVVDANKPITFGRREEAAPPGLAPWAPGLRDRRSARAERGRASSTA